MKHALIAPAVAAMVALPLAALGQDGAEPASRYHITPSDGGFVRLDTETGTVSHCLNRGGTWVCEPAEEAGGSDEAMAELVDLVGTLTGRLDRLAEQVEMLQSEIDRLAAATPETVEPRETADAPPADEAMPEPAGLAEQTEATDANGPSLASRLIGPLQDMVGDIKRGIADAAE